MINIRFRLFAEACFVLFVFATLVMELSEVVVCIIQTGSVAGGVMLTCTGPTLIRPTESAHLHQHSPCLPERKSCSDIRVVVTLKHLKP